jgi:MoaA/NifB/PqqE/SkfB family radical SAM enzyme
MKETRKYSVPKDRNKVFKQATEGGTEVAIFSGGGEPLLRSYLGDVIEHANKAGLYTMIYTNGSRLEKLSKDNSKLYKSLLNAD